jgi:protein-S-isoprenylcysteine O-methyltransferase Ste14
MNKTDWTRVGALYVPMMAALLAGMVSGKRSKRFAACLLSALWVMTSLLVLQRVNELVGWWSFKGDGAVFCGMPGELYLGWVVLWGLVPQLSFQRLGIIWVAAAMAAVDLLAMPMCGAVVSLGPRWLVGEAMAVAIVLVPALCVARWTMDDTYLRLRAAIQVATSGMLFLLLVPELVFCVRPGMGWGPLLRMTGWQRQLELQAICLLALPGVAAVLEFVERGLGTPIPYDPPKQLVTSGVYRYCANPMQVSCGLVMLAWAGMLHNWWLGLGAALSALYSAGIARWDEGEDLEQRFGELWVAYRAQVRNWWPRWRPYHAGNIARLYMARGCGPCSELRGWLVRKGLVGLEIVDAETLGWGSIRRIRYEPGDGSGAVDGVRALGRALEHIHFGWALCGAALRLPVVWWGVQVVMDAGGLGPRVVGNEVG